VIQPAHREPGHAERIGRLFAATALQVALLLLIVYWVGRLVRGDALQLLAGTAVLLVVSKVLPWNQKDLDLPAAIGQWLGFVVVVAIWGWWIRLGWWDVAVVLALVTVVFGVQALVQWERRRAGGR